jgi:photosystem II stability/assembly factor-like uncharacterized protein
MNYLGRKHARTNITSHLLCSRLSRSIRIRAIFVFTTSFLLLGPTLLGFSSSSTGTSQVQSVKSNRVVAQNFDQVTGSAGSLPQTAPLKAHQKSLESSDISLHYSDPPSSWVPLGPQPIATNTTFTWGEPPFSGRITAIAVNGSNSAEIFVGAAQGGVWKSTDGGITWTPLMDSEPNLAVGAIALSPDNKTIYVGTGEPNQCGDCYFGTGLYKSTDGGSTWTVLGSSVFSGSAISSIWINPSNPSDILVSTTTASCCNSYQYTYNPSGVGIFQSKDGGSSWNLVLSPSSRLGVNDLVADPHNASIVYAGDFSGYVWESTDGGTSWNYILYENSSANQGRVAVAVSAALPNTIFAAFVNKTGANGAAGLLGIFEYNLTSGIITTLAMPPNVIDHYGDSVPPCGSNEQCFYDLVLSVDPTNPNNIYFGATTLYGSTNGGSSWTPLGGYEAGSVLHPDFHALAFLPGNPNTIYVGNDGGLWESANQGTSWNDLNQNLGIAQFYHLAISNSGKLILGGAQDNGCNEYNGSISWNQVATGDGGWVGFDPANNQIMYCVRDGLPLKSTDGGKTFQLAYSGITQLGSLDAPMAQDPNNPDTLYFGAQNIIYNTTNNMQSWTALFLDQHGNILSIAVAPSNSNIIYAGDSAGNVIISTNAGLTWSILGTAFYPITSITVNPANANDVYVAGSSFQFPVIIEFLNGIENIVSTTSLPSSSVNVIKIYEGKMFAGLDSGGVYYLPLGTSSWAQVGPNLPNAAVFDLAAINGTLYAATHGRGVWAINTTLVEQVSLTLSYQVVDGGSGYAPPTLTYVNNGVPRTATLYGTPATFVVDYGSVWSVSSVLPGSGTTERWASSETGGQFPPGTTMVLSYYNQYKQTISYSVIDGGNPSVPSATGSQFGVTYSPTITTTPTGYWFDATGSITFTNSMNGGTGERWITATVTLPATSSATTALSYYHQYSVPVYYSVSGSGSGYSAPILTYNYFGSSTPVTLATTPNTLWMDASSWSVTNPLGGSTSTEQWETYASSGTVASTNPISPVYYHQYSVSFSYSVAGGGSGYSAPTLTYTSLGSGQIISLTTTPTFYWIDSGGSWSVPNPLGGSSSSERWETNTSSGTVSGSTSISLLYFHQFFVSWNASPNAGGALSPSQAGWYDSGAVVQISATPSSNYGFSGWNSSTPLITFGNPASPTTTVTIDGSGTIQANFYLLGAEFPFQFAIVAIVAGVAILIVVSYLVVRRRL